MRELYVCFNNQISVSLEPALVLVENNNFVQHIDQPDQLEFSRLLKKSHQANN